MKYLVNIDGGKLKVIFEYNAEGYLTAFKIDSRLAKEGIVWLHQRMPFISEELETWRTKIRNVVIETIQDDTTFTGFWNAYNYKVGNKKRAEKLWALLREDEKLQTLVAIRKYDRYLAQHTKMERAYPETFLAQRRWENEYK